MKTIITVAQYDVKFSAELPPDATIYEVIESFRYLLAAVGYSENLIDDLIPNCE